MTVEDQVAALRDTANESYDRIRNNLDLSADAKRRQIAKTYVATKSALDTLQADTTTATSNRRDILARKLYGIPNTADASAMISYRDAQDRAGQLDDPTTAVALLNRAQTSGDDLLVRAVLEQGYTQVWSDVVNAYEASSPTSTTNAEELWDLVLTSVGGKASFLTHLTYVTPVPPELANMSPWKIDEIANATSPTTQTLA